MWERHEIKNINSTEQDLIYEIKHNKRVEIYKKMYPNFEIKFNTPEEDGDYN